MRSLFVVLFSLFIATVANANTYKNLEDLPKHWTGKAGDLFQTMNATFDLESVVLVKEEETDGILITDYDVKAHFAFGNKIIPLKKIRAIVYKILPDAPVELTLTTGDELLGNINASLSVEQGKYFIKEAPQTGSQRRFVLNAPKP